MKKKDKKQRDPIPQYVHNIEEVQDFWDTHDLTDYEDLLREVHFDADIQTISCPIDFDAGLLKELRACARAMGVSLSELVNAWMKERLNAAKQGRRREKAMVK